MLFEKIEKLQILISAIVISFALLVSVTFAAAKFVRNEGIAVTGSAYKIVKSDSGSLTFYINCEAKSKSDAYDKVSKQFPIINDYLKSVGLNDNDVEYKNVNGYYTYKYTPEGRPTNVIDHYNLTQEVQVKSNNVEMIKSLASSIQSLLAKGVDLNVNSPQFYYSDLGSLKIELLEEATKDAKSRAKAMLKATNNGVGKIKSVRMGVFQITPVDSTSVSDMGISDTSTIDKKITAVANVVFFVK